MWTRKFAIVVIAVVSLILSACTPATTGTIGADASASTTVTDDAGAVQSSDQPQESEESGVETDATDTSESVLPIDRGPVEPPEDDPAGDELPESSDSGAGESNAGEQSPPGEAGGAIGAGTMRLYTDNTYHFSVSFPDTYSLSTLPAESLADFIPSPVVVFRLLNPTLAASDAPESEAADLEIRVFAVNPSETVESWLVTYERLPADGSVKPTPYAIANANGLEVCSSFLIGPGCSYYVRSGERLYELTPASAEGEALMQGFVLQ